MLRICGNDLCVSISCICFVVCSTGLLTDSEATVAEKEFDPVVFKCVQELANGNYTIKQSLIDTLVPEDDKVYETRRRHCNGCERADCHKPLKPGNDKEEAEDDASSSVAQMLQSDKQFQCGPPVRHGLNYAAAWELAHCDARGKMWGGGGSNVYDPKCTKFWGIRREAVYKPLVSLQQLATMCPSTKLLLDRCRPWLTDWLWPNRPNADADEDD